jgi:hypothetical protein
MTNLGVDISPADVIIQSRLMKIERIPADSGMSPIPLGCLQVLAIGSHAPPGKVYPKLLP